MARAGAPGWHVRGARSLTRSMPRTQRESFTATLSPPTFSSRNADTYVRRVAESEYATNGLGPENHKCSISACVSRFPQSHSVPGQLPIQCLPTECCGSYRDYQERRCSFPFPTFCGSKPRETMPAYTPPAAVTCCGKPWHTCHFPKITRSAMERGHSFDYMQTDKISSLQSTLSTFWYPVESNLRPWNGISPNKSVLRQKSESGVSRKTCPVPVSQD
jgi:hypothetical protein